MKIQKVKETILHPYIIVLFIILNEVIFSYLCFQTINIGIGILFSIPIALCVDSLTTTFKEEINQIIFKVIVIINGCVYMIYYLFYQMLGNILTFTTIGNGTMQATAFVNILLQTIAKNWYILLAWILLLGFQIYFTKRIDFHKRKKKLKIFEILSIVLIHLLTLITILTVSEILQPDETYSLKNLYFRLNSTNQNAREFGLLTTIRLDIEKKITGFKEENIYKYQNENGEEKNIFPADYNMQLINFQELIQQETDEEIKETLEYLTKQEPTKKNEYTGKFKGKNLIVFVAESFSNLAIHQDLTPTLYKIQNTGLQFTNFYTPLFPVSTADGEYLTDTSLVPAEGIWSMENVKGKIFPYSYANALKPLGYQTYAYHNFQYDYYQLDDYLEAMGYDTYLGNGNGLENRMQFNDFPTSDYEMAKETIDDYINKDKFLAYYLTTSGHGYYNNTNAMSRKNWDLVKNLSYSMEAKAYLSAQIELDRAVSYVIEKLKETGKIEDTVILITGDHYPCLLETSARQELGEGINTKFDKFHMPLLIYDGENSENIKIDKLCWTLDVLPTILNLFGIEFDSRLLMGKDIFSDTEEFVFFSDRSFITNEMKYNAISKTYETMQNSKQQEEVNQEYIRKYQQIIYHKYRYSRLILEKDIYSKINY